MNWNTARFGAYILGFLSFIAMVLAQLGYGTYDPATFSYDPAPIDLRILAGFIITGLTPLLAAVAWLKGWSRR